MRGVGDLANPYLFFIRFSSIKNIYCVYYSKLILASQLPPPLHPSKDETTPSYFNGQRMYTTLSQDVTNASVSSHASRDTVFGKARPSTETAEIEATKAGSNATTFSPSLDTSTMTDRSSTVNNVSMPSAPSESIGKNLKYNLCLIEVVRMT